MHRQPLTFSPSYLAFARGLRELHRLALEGRDDSPEADAVRDATDGPWEALSETERRRLSGLSEDLYSISDPLEGELKTNPQAEAKLVEAVTAREHGEWDRALEILRRWEKFFPPALVSNLRGTIWQEAGDPETAVIFCERAAELEPQNGEYLAYYLHVLGSVDPTQARGRSEEILQNADNYHAVVVAQAADIVLKNTRLAPEAEAVFRELIPVLERSLASLGAVDEGGLDQSTYLLSTYLLGLCNELLGNSQAASGCYSRGLQVDPNHDGLLVARGILLYGSSPRAITDFERAVAIGISAILPHYCLAHHHLINGRFKDSLAMCERALRMPAPAWVKSELTEWAAICQAELGFSSESVGASFETSIRLNPSNDRARRNLAAFEEAMRPPITKRWETPTEAVVRASGMSARQYAPAA
jgi:tetratricopeptide (TPR) repeat protein